MKLVIVESPTKAKTIQRFLGKEYIVESSFGHVRDLPKKDTGIDVEHDFRPTYENSERGRETIRKLKAAFKKSQGVILATDEDREGEAISWHLTEALGIDRESTDRIVFHEITQEAIEEALAHPRRLDMRLVDAQQARRVLDRLVGYELSPLLWRKIGAGLSAGRVQSVAVRLIVERERERTAFEAQEYWSLEADVETHRKEVFRTRLVAWKGETLDKMALKSQGQVQAIEIALRGVSWVVSGIESKPVRKQPPAPFTTSTLQQEAYKKLGFSSKLTMSVAQRLYEGVQIGGESVGLITYMRTDSVHVSEKFVSAARTYIEKTFGKTAVSASVRSFGTKSKLAQEAHEAIRPTSAHRAPDTLRAVLSDQEYKLYNLIWARTIATQMAEAIINTTAVDITAGEALFRANGQQIQEEGFLRVYGRVKESELPHLEPGDALVLQALHPQQHFTEPPPRYNDASLVKIMEEYGIGRPSTYAPTINTIITRGYVERDDQKRFMPTNSAFMVTDFLLGFFPAIIDYRFTAQMEDDLDGVAQGDKNWVDVVRLFYAPFHARIEDTTQDVSRAQVAGERVIGTDPETGYPIIVRRGRFGPYVQVQIPEAIREQVSGGKKSKMPTGKTASLPSALNPETVTLNEALELLQFPKLIGVTSEKEEVSVCNGPYGYYVKIGKKNISIPKEGHYNPLTITLDEALQLHVEAQEKKALEQKPLRELGVDPETKKPIVVKNGRFGPYITDGVVNASVGAKIDVDTLDLVTALAMLARKKELGGTKKRSSYARKKKAGLS